MADFGDGPDRIGPDTSPKLSLADRTRNNGRTLVKLFTTKEGLVGDYDYKFLFTPNIPFIKRERRAAPFFGLNDSMPLLLALLLGFQHALAMLAGIVTPPIILGGAGGVALPVGQQQYLVSTSLIVCGLLSSLQISRFHIYKTPYYFGTGLLSVVGTSFATIPVATGAFAQMYSSGYCPSSADGTRLACPQGYGALIGTAAVCGLLEVLLSFLPARALKKIFPPLVTGPVVTLIGVNLTATGFRNWAGGSGPCLARPTTGFFVNCPNNAAPHPLPWGSAEFIGLGFTVFLTIILCERFGSPIMKSTAVVIGLLVGCIVAAATNYFDDSGITSAKAASFIWVETVGCRVLLSDIVPTVRVRAARVTAAGRVHCAGHGGDWRHYGDFFDGPEFDSRIQGGILADGINGILANLCTITPVSVFAQNNGVIALTRCASRRAGLCACFWLVVAGIFSKFAAALVAIPSAVLGGMTTFLFGAVAVSGIRIISTVPFTRRNRFILTAAMSVGFGATMVPTWFSYVFTYQGDNRALEGFFNAIELVMETGFVVAGFLALLLHVSLPEEVEDDEAVALEGANVIDEAKDNEEWARIHKHKEAEATMEPGKAGSGSEGASASGEVKI